MSTGTITTYDRHGRVVNIVRIFDDLDTRDNMIRRWRRAGIKFRCELDGSLRRWFPLRPEAASEVIRWDAPGGEG